MLAQCADPARSDAPTRRGPPRRRRFRPLPALLRPLWPSLAVPSAAVVFARRQRTRYR
jgi:hypothetical protein